jgi:F0F1-type ATP synthase assembly protein I
MNPDDESGIERRSHLRKIRFRGQLLWMAIGGVLIGSLGLFLVTGLASSPWLFLLYPLLIGLLGVSLLVLALQLLHRL